jgi:ATP-dependent HslUV protease ATP-binding subunit HslU
MEKLLEELPSKPASHGKQTALIDAAYVDGRLEMLAQREDLASYVL